MKIIKGEVWKVRSRSFTGVIEILEDIEDTKKDDFFNAKIIEGTTHYLNKEDISIGAEFSLRTTLTDFREKVK